MFFFKLFPLQPCCIPRFKELGPQFFSKVFEKLVHHDSYLGEFFQEYRSLKGAGHIT